MTTTGQPSARRTELLESAYRYVLAHGLTDMSLRPLAEEIGSSPRVLLFLFGSKDGRVRALLARARAEERALLDSIGATHAGAGLVDVGRALWRWLAAPEQRRLLALWVEGYARSLVGAGDAWANFGRQTVDDWLVLLADVAPDSTPARRTAVLAILRGALLDLLATGDVDRTTAAVDEHLSAMTP